MNVTSKRRTRPITLTLGEDIIEWLQAQGLAKRSSASQVVREIVSQEMEYRTDRAREGEQRPHPTKRKAVLGAER